MKNLHLFFTLKPDYTIFKIADSWEPGKMIEFTIKKTRRKEESVSKSIYMKRSMADRIEKIAKENNTSFNNVVVSLLEACLKDD